MSKKINLEAERAYKTIRGEKNKFGSYRKTLFHVHTPESHDYRLFKKWKDLPENDWNNLTIDDYIKEIRNQKIFPKDFLQIDKGEKVLYENYFMNGFSSEKEQVAFLTIAQSLYNENISVVVVSDHNTISGIEKLKTAIKLVSDLFQNKCKEYIEVINGVEISCADKVHVLVAFPNSKASFIQKWLNFNLMSIKEGSFKASLEVLEKFIYKDCFAYIAHMNSSDVFKEGHFSNAYKKKLFSKAYARFIGVSNIAKIDDINSYLTKYLKKNVPSFILDNDSHCVEEHSINPMWIKFSKRNYEQLREALSEYDVSIELMNPEISKAKAIRGIYVPTLSNSYLLKNNSEFVIKFSESLNCLIGGRGTGKSTILDLIQFVLSQKADTKQKFEFLSQHSRVYILYEMSKKEYLVELNLPTQKDGEDIYETFGVKTKSTSKFWYYESRLEDKIREKYKDDPQTLNQKTMEIYKENNVNPMGGCLPILIQMPIFVALYYAFVGNTIPSDATFLWFNLKQPDHFMKLGTFTINLLPILNTLVTFIQQKVMMGVQQQDKNNPMSSMLYTMPLMMLFIFYNMPSGVTLYYLVSGVLSVLQQYFIMKGRN